MFEAINTRVSRETSFYDRLNADQQRNRNCLEGDLSCATPAGQVVSRMPALERQLLSELGDVAGQRVLIYGCGVDGSAIWFARRGAIVDAVDISEQALMTQRSAASRHGVQVNFHRANAHDTQLESQTYDLIYGNAILHHLETAAAAAELARLLKSSGTAVFRDVQAGNLGLRVFRYLTPQWHTRDEHPLTSADFNFYGKHFATCKTSAFCLTGMPIHVLAKILRAAGWRNVFKQLAWCYRLGDRWDQWLFQRLGFLKSQAWMCLLVMSLQPAEQNRARIAHRTVAKDGDQRCES